jgi:CRP-like cAMP-binding protein
MNLREELKGAFVCKELTDEEIEKIVPLCVEENHPAGTELYREGDPADKLYIVKKGKTALDLKNTMSPYDPPSRMIVDMISPGETMGWSALVEPHIYTLSCKCAEDCSLISISGPGLKDLISRECQIGLKMMTAIAKIISIRLVHTRVLFIGERGLRSVSPY